MKKGIFLVTSISKNNSDIAILVFSISAIFLKTVNQEQKLHKIQKIHNLKDGNKL